MPYQLINLILFQYLHFRYLNMLMMWCKQRFPLPFCKWSHHGWSPWLISILVSFGIPISGDWQQQNDMSSLETAWNWAMNKTTKAPVIVLSQGITIGYTVILWYPTWGLVGRENSQVKLLLVTHLRLEKVIRFWFWMFMIWMFPKIMVPSNHPF